MTRRTKRFVALAAVVVLSSMGSASASPGNDDILDATLIPSVPFTDELVTQGATIEGSEQQPCGGIGSTVWYHYTAPGYGTLVAHTFGSDFDTALAVYRGSVFDLQPVACNTDALGPRSRVTFSTSPGQTYYFQVGGEWGDEGNLSFTLARPAAVEGTVSDAADGDELADVCVDVFSTEHTWLGTGSTDAEGDYHIALLPEGDAKVRFTDCDEGTYAREWYNDQTSFATAQTLTLVAGTTTGAVDASLGIRPGPDLLVGTVTVEPVPLEVAGQDVPGPTTYNRRVVVTAHNEGPLAGRRVVAVAEVCPRTIGSCRILGEKWLGRVEPGAQETVTFRWNAIDTVGDVSLFVTVRGTRDMDWDDNVTEMDESLWIGGTGFGIRACRLPGTEFVPCV